MQLLQVEKGKLRPEMQLGEKQSEEVEELRQRLLDSEERVIIAEQEAEQWKVEAEKLSAVLTGVQEESEKIEKSLVDQVAEKTSLVEQLKKAVSELQLKADNLRAQNLLLTTRMGDKSRSTLHVHTLETACDNEASLRSTTTVTSATGGLVSRWFAERGSGW